MNFRYDINGLRAIAVLAVVIFHFNPQWLPGGFAGVDVFFVISGFLMTSIIFNGVEKNTFNLFKFYNARANRIVPVLAAMSAVLLIFGWFYLLPTDYRDLGRQVEKSSFFISNLLFAKGGGYFDTAEHTKWLLHTWSLSVEWQFYIFFPIIIIALKKYLSFTNLKRIVIGLFLASFIYCIYATYKDSKTAYFLLTSRAWEMLLGGLAFLYPWSPKNKLHQITAQSFGLILIVTSYFLISKNTPWPGYMALIPVLGAYLIIVSNYQNNPLVNNPIFSLVGNWSYSIYVWHWPLVVLGFYFSFENWWLYGIPLSFLLGFLSYHFIEKTNFPRYESWREIYKVKPFYILLIVLACGYIVKKTDGMKFHYSENINTMISEISNHNKYRCEIDPDKIQECILGNPNNIKAIIVGDSHADMLLSSATSVIDLNKEGIMALVTGGCPLLKNASFNNHKNCKSLNIERMKIIEKEKYNGIPIFLSARLANYFEGDIDPEKKNYQILPMIKFDSVQNASKLTNPYKLLEDNLTETLSQISRNNIVYIIQPIPEMPFNVPKTLAKNELLNINTNTILTYNDYLKRSKSARDAIVYSAKRSNSIVLDSSIYLCKNGICLNQINGRPIYRDGDHLSEFGNKLLAPMFKAIINP